MIQSIRVVTIYIIYFIVSQITIFTTIDFLIRMILFEISINKTQTRTANMTQNDSDQPGQNEEHVPKRGAASVTWMWFGYERSATDQKTVLFKLCCRLVPLTDSDTTDLFYPLHKNNAKQYVSIDPFYILYIINLFFVACLLEKLHKG